MNDPRRDDDSSADQPTDSLRSRGKSWLARWTAFDLRDRWWRLLDLFEARRGLRWALYGGVAAILALAAARVWLYPWWNKRNAISMAHQWIAARQLDNAALAVQTALTVAPERP